MIYVLDKHTFFAILTEAQLNLLEDNIVVFLRKFKPVRVNSTLFFPYIYIPQKLIS